MSHALGAAIRTPPTTNAHPPRCRLFRADLEITGTGFRMPTISTSIDIEAAPERVWRALTEFDTYADWNPFIREGSGEAVVGSTLTLRMYPKNGRPVSFRPTVLAAEPGRLLRWKGRFVLPGLFDGTHDFELTASATGTRVVQSEAFSGVLVPFLGRMISDTEQNFTALNQALKNHVER